MLWTGTFSSAQEALEYFANRRTYNLVKTLMPVAVTSPSQVRYVHYLEQVLKFDVDFGFRLGQRHNSAESVDRRSSAQE